VSSSLLPVSADLSFEKSWRVADLGSKEGAEQQLCHSWPEIPTETKQSERQHCHGGETNLQ